MIPRILVGVLLLAACVCNAWAAPVLPTLFSDHMVLQQGREIHVWGKADAGEEIKVTLAGKGASTITDGSGAWSVHLPALSAGGPFTLTVNGQKEIVIRDVMIGEVWIASGQSNMAFGLEGAEGAAREIPQASDPQLRLFTVPKRIALSPQDDTLPAHWELCTPDTAKTFSAVAYFFAREIRRRLNVPVGMVQTVWPGTPIEEWIAPEFLQADPELKPILDLWNQMPPAVKTFAKSPTPFELEFDDFELIPASGDSKTRVLANFDDGSSALTTGGSFSYSWKDAGDSLFELVSPGHNHGLAARVAGRLDGTLDSILNANYKSDGSALDLTSYGGIRFWVRGNGSFRFRSKQPTIDDYDDYATAVMKATPEWQPITIMFRDLRQDGWGVSKDFTQSALTGFSFENLTSLGYVDMPISTLYDGMIAPLVSYSFRGALWYQGESNALRAHQYRKLLPAMIRNWREATHENDLEFLIVQLPNHGAIPEQPSESAWAELREAQLMTVNQISHTGLAVTIDVGDPKDLHPHRKREVGERLALWALGTVYHQDGEYSGPLYKSVQFRGSEARVSFSHTGAGLVPHPDGIVHGFALAGADHKFYWADARIEGNGVVLTSPAVTNPVAVRYAWGDSPVCNLFNKDGLPASPFRTDDWPGITDTNQKNP
jgi:sialate O-acetylesterase